MAQEPVLHQFRRLFLHPREYMTVDVHRDPYSCMTEPLADHFRMNPGSKQVRRVAVSQIVKTDARETGLLYKTVEVAPNDVVSMKWPAIRWRDGM